MLAIYDGYQLIRKSCNEIIKTSQANSFIAIKDSVQGSDFKRQSMVLNIIKMTHISEKIAVKF
jgi:hypothetical protein